MKTKIQIRNRWSNNIIFEHTTEGNTIKGTLIEAKKRGISLRGADLRHADLSGVYLDGANLSDANLFGTDLSHANLFGAHLFRANIGCADLQYTDLRYANLISASLRETDLRHTILDYANLINANLSGANLYDTNLFMANLYNTDLTGAKDIPYIPYACPSDGSFIGWKKVYGQLIKLEIPADAKRCSATTQKCRCDKAKVLAITDLEGSNPIDEIENTAQKHHILYKVGEMVYPDSFDDNRWNECSHGIHFFVNKQDAINY